MYVTRLRLDGVRGFRGARACDLDFTRPDGSCAGWTVLAGRNGSGKTTLLRTIALALAGPERASRLDNEIEDHLSYGLARGLLELTLRADPDVDLGAPRPSDRLRTAVEWGPDREPLTEDDEPPTRARFVSHTKATRLLWSPSPPAGWFHAAYGPFRRLSGTGMRERDPQTSDRAEALRTLFQEESALTESVEWLVSVRMRQMEGEAGVDRLLESVLALLNHGLLPGDFRVEEVTSRGLWLRRVDGEGPLIALRRMSDGLRTVTALVLDVVRQMYAAYGTLELRRDDGRPYLPHPGVVLIDEVDAHLHVSWQQRIGEWFKVHFPAVQFIVTTHSPYICQAADPGGLISLPGPNEQVPPEVVDDKLYGRVVYGTGDDAVLSDFFGLESPFSRRAEEMREELADLEYEVATGQADEEMTRRFRKLRRELASSQATRLEELDLGARRGEAGGS
ncbi:AAA family ATPase [Streptomyces sp. NEAU-Y11]|uniref:AAA family ATPase n=1 Tax=Streptomyces cucumeris TaxID=2962890 RepID=UPI0020C90CFC|nr:AAA family ATPase [Streptomyces sp. NEAU-Y11]MCP9207146.1 AAA family ATPase [Streptomyces sp. NEAU-Y11]